MFRSPAEFHSSMENLPQPKRKTSLDANDKSLIPPPTGEIRYLAGIVVQVQDLRKATRALEKLGLKVIHLPSTGAFLGRRNVTLLVGMPESMQDKVMQAIQETCHQRVEYVSTPLEGAPMPIPLSTPISVGGATVFVMDIERFEEI